MSLDYLFSYLVSFTVLIPFTNCILARKKKNKTINTIWILLAIDIIIAIIAEFHIQAGRRASLYLNSYVVLQFIMLSVMYAHLLPHWRKWIYLLIPAYIGFFTVNSIYLETIMRIQNNSLVVQSVIMIIYSGFYYRHIRNTIEREPPLFSYGPFWINTAFGNYFFFSIGLFFMANKILTELEPATARMIWNVYGLTYIMRNVFLTVGIRQIHKAKDDEFNYKRFGVDKNWQEHMKPNPNRDKLKDTSEEDKWKDEA